MLLNVGEIHDSVVSQEVMGIPKWGSNVQRDEVQRDGIMVSRKASENP
jgi:hypothetical protein